MSGAQLTPAPIEPEKNWFRRHLILSISIGIALLAIGFVVALLFGILSILRSSDVYKQALEKARNTPAVAEALGKPIEAGWWFTGNINVSGPSGSADLAIPISGPKGSGTIYAVATKRAGEWRFKLLEVAVEGQAQRIPLISPQSVAEPAVREQ